MCDLFEPMTMLVNIIFNSKTIFRYWAFQDSARISFERDLHVTKNLISRLGLEHELDGHSGCVNCLEWNETGR